MRFPRKRATLLEQLPWETFVVGTNAGTSADRMAILRTLARLAETELKHPVGRMNDGKSALALLSRLIGSTRELRTSYIDEATILANELMSRLEAGILPSEVLIETILGTLLSVRVEDSWTDGDHFHFSHGMLLPQSDRGKQIMSYCDRLWAVATNPAAEQVRYIAINLLAKHHQSLNSEQLIAKHHDWSFLLRGHLESARSLAASGTLSLPLWFGLRRIWEWHMNHDKDPELKAIAVECEALFRAESSRGAFAALLLDGDAKEAAISSVASQLRDEKPAAMATLFDQGCRFLVDDQHGWRRRKLETLAWQMGEGGMGDNLREYVVAAIRAGSQSIQFPFAIEILGAHLQHLRTAGDEARLPQEVREAIINSPDEASTAALLVGVYQQTRLLAIRDIRALECDVIIEHLNLFEQNQQLRFLGCIFAIDSARARPKVEALLTEAFTNAPFELKALLQYFCVGFHVFALGRKTPLFSQADYVWLLNQIARIPNVPEFAQMGELDEAIEHFPKFGVQWFVELIFQRFEQLKPLLERERDVFQRGEAIWVLTADFPFLELVAPLADEYINDADRAAIERLMELTTEDQSVSHYLWSVVERLEPYGRLVPELVCARLQRLKDPTWRDAAIWADYARAYPFGSDSWRRIALPACSIANSFDTNDAARLYSHLVPHRNEGWSGRPGVVHERWFKAVDHAKELLDNETEPVLRKFREWRVTCAERDLRFEEGRQAEERRELHGAPDDN